MARKARIEYAGACYHVMNRGNFRSWIFETEGARASFLKCLETVCQAKGWRLHAWCLMGNHYHLCVETPEPNLVSGMRWLQSTFANRFNRFRGANGHVFQGRYKAILLDGDAIGPVCHYIHLNPVRAGLVKVDDLASYPHCSFTRLWRPRFRRAFEVVDLFLADAGGLRDEPAGWRSYRDFLEWLSENDAEKKRLGFEKMTRGWAKGGGAFKKAVLKDMEEDRLAGVVEAEAAEMREPLWERTLADALARMGRDDADLGRGRKGEPWKIAIARDLRDRHLVPYRWIARRLSMGAPSYVQSLVSRDRSGKNRRPGKHGKHGKLD